MGIRDWQTPATSGRTKRHSSLFHYRPRFTLTIGPEQHDAAGVAGGQQHAVRFLAPQHGLLEVIDHDKLAADKLFGRVVAANAGP